MAKLNHRFLKLSKKTLAVICVVLIFTNFIAVGWVVYVNSTAKHPEDYPLIDVARSYVDQKDFIVNVQPLKLKMLDIIGKEPPQTVSVYFEYLNTGANIQLNSDERYYPASLVKLASAFVTMKKVEDKTWNFDDRLVLFEKDKDDRFGDLYKQPVGTSFTIYELLEYLLIDSDNTAHNILMRNLSDEELNNLQTTIGLDDLFDKNGEVTAKEYSRMYRALYSSSYLSREGSEKLLELLSKSQFNDYMPSGLPEGVKVSHKIGEDDVGLNYLDSGIIYVPGRPYLLTIMVKAHDKAESQAIMKAISKSAYEYVYEHKN